VGIASKLQQGVTFAKARVLGAKVPLVVSMVVTNRCNYACAYCDRWDGRGTRLETAQITSMLNDMARLGTRRVVFTGGEPLIRKDMLDLIDHAARLGIAVNLNSNGALVPRHIDRLSALSTLTISLDGDRHVHDGIRGDGAFDGVIEALRAAERHPHLKRRLTAVISAQSIGGEDALLDLARQERVTVFFQPAENERLGSGGDDNPIAPPLDRYRETIDHLIEQKRRGAPIANSLSGLRYLRGWPDAPALPCAGSFLFCRVDQTGRLMICGRMGAYEESFDAATLGFEKAFLSLNPARCPTCWCASRVEVNQAFALRPDAILALASGMD
jgi:MoaA/NifB/PqqE/SkfB family radical SAM enzyme